MWRDFWTLSRLEQRCFFMVIVILVMVVVVLLMPNQMRYRETAALLLSLSDSTLTSTSEQPKSHVGAVLQRFNPNTVSIKQLEEMGLSLNAILNWKKYLEAGGCFRNITDVKRLYGIDTMFVARLADSMVFDVIPRKPRLPVAVGYSKGNDFEIDLNRVNAARLKSLGIDDAVADSVMKIRNTHWFKKTYTLGELKNIGVCVSDFFHNALAPRHARTSETNFVVEVNAADTSQLTLIKGIGPVLARRIVQFRRKLGGFYHLDQLLQVYGMPPTVVELAKPFLKVDNSLITPLNINQASLRRMKEHPLLGYYRAQAIVDLRQKNGPIRHLDDVMSLMVFADVDAQMYSHYFCLQ
ncbi:MAG: helix-hairpin-helix domain-containing protein [Marinilabiliaceae bacterium]|nr:helix-hairpin-helix domain-containing protein [Marinilabiliaceae bacterium]